MNQTVQTYFDAFNAGDADGMLACLSDDVAHHVNEGQIRVGKEKFAAFCAHMNRCYKREPDRHRGVRGRRRHPRSSRVHRERHLSGNRRRACRMPMARPIACLPGRSLI